MPKINKEDCFDNQLTRKVLHYQEVYQKYTITKTEVHSGLFHVFVKTSNYLRVVCGCSEGVK